MKWLWLVHGSWYGGIALHLVPLSGIALAQTSADDEFRHPAPKEVPSAVAAARVEAEVKVKSGAGGGNLIMRRITPPALVVEPQPPREVSTEASEERIEAEETARVTDHSTKWFIPSIEIHPDGFSLVRWQAWGRELGWRSFEAWVALDLTSIDGCGRFTVGNTTYELIPNTYRPPDSANRSVPPKAGEMPEGYFLTQGDANDQEGMEPLLAVIQLYAQEGDDIVQRHQQIVQRRVAWERWKEENPKPVTDTVISFWPIKSTEHPTGAAAR